MPGSAHDRTAASPALRERFRHWAETTAGAIGTPVAFFVAVGTVGVWAVCGPLFGFSDTWQLVINTGTTIVTFLIVFLIQNTQNRDTRIINLKLDELLRAHHGARNSFIGLDHVSEDELEELQVQFTELAERFGGLIGDDLEQVERELHVRRRRRSPS